MTTALLTVHVARAQTSAAPTSGAAPPPPGAEPARAGRPPLGVPRGKSSSHNEDSGQTETAAERANPKGKRLKWHGTTFFVDQSVSSQTIGLGSDFQSSDPVYELWYSFRPRYYFYETEKDSVNVNARFDVFHELTNSGSTTRESEPLFGDIWLNGVYDRWLVRDARRGYSTRLSVGPRLILGTSKAARAAGTRMQLGGGGGVKQTLPLRGPNAKSFQTFSVGGRAYYTKQINRCTTPCDSDFTYTRQDSGGRSLVSDQISGTSLVNHQVLASVDVDVDILEKLAFSASHIWVMQWLYPVGEPSPIMTPTGPVNPSRTEDPETFRVSPWLLASLQYSIIEELDVSIGYYNFANQLGPDGTRRNPFWSPGARFFLTLTANLDVIYEAGADKPKSTERSRTVSFAAQPAKF